MTFERLTLLPAADEFGVATVIAVGVDRILGGGRGTRQGIASQTRSRAKPLLHHNDTAEFAELFRELSSVGRVMSQFDLLIAALARQRGLILLTADQDFQSVTGLDVENWF
ncbi:MAG: PIN domain-containing protein [Planctomycetota bacterium]|nr:PIN domain-containing protein [Planctomycetota bacterium]